VNYASSNDFGGKLCRALGIDPMKHGIIDITLTLKSQDIARVQMTELMTNEQAECTYELLKNYVLAEPPSDTEESGGKLR